MTKAAAGVEAATLEAAAPVEAVREAATAVEAAAG